MKLVFSEPLDYSNHNPNNPDNFIFAFGRTPADIASIDLQSQASITIGSFGTLSATASSVGPLVFKGSDINLFPPTISHDTTATVFTLIGSQGDLIPASFTAFKVRVVNVYSASGDLAIRDTNDSTSNVLTGSIVSASNSSP